MTDNGNPLVIATRHSEIELKVTFVVDESDTVAFSFEPAGNALVFDKDNMAEAFEQAGVTMKSGTYVLVMGINPDDGEQRNVFTELPEGFDPETAALLLSEEVELGKLFRQLYSDLNDAHRNFPDGETIEHMAGAIVSTVLTTGMNDDDPLRQNLNLPTIEQIKGLELVGACAQCAFIDPQAVMMAMFSGKSPDEVEPKPGTNTVAGVRFRAELLGDGQIAVPIGYLAHENPWEKTFHAELVARLAPIVPTVVRETLEGVTVQLERKLRMEQNFRTALLETYDFEPDAISVLADQREAEIREELHRRRQAEELGIPPFLADLMDESEILGPDGEPARS